MRPITCDGCGETGRALERYEVLVEVPPEVVVECPETYPAGEQHTQWIPASYCVECKESAIISADCNRRGLSFNGQGENYDIRRPDGPRRAPRCTST